MLLITLSSFVENTKAYARTNVLILPENLREQELLLRLQAIDTSYAPQFRSLNQRRTAYNNKYFPTNIGRAWAD